MCLKESIPPSKIELVKRSSEEAKRRGAIEDDAEDRVSISCKSY